ncbi:uncharacterized protein LOC102806251 isoform X4 [Saccoglossus kowalevskii]
MSTKAIIVFFLTLTVLLSFCEAINYCQLGIKNKCKGPRRQVIGKSVSSSHENDEIDDAAISLLRTILGFRHDSYPYVTTPNNEY